MLIVPKFSHKESGRTKPHFCLLKIMRFIYTRSKYGIGETNIDFYFKIVETIASINGDLSRCLALIKVEIQVMKN